MLEDTKTSALAERSSRREPLDEGDVKSLLGKVRRVIVARGSRVEILEAAKVRPSDLKGPTGNFRAPMVMRGPTLLVGFHEGALRELLG